MQRQTDLAELATLLLAAGARDPANASSSATALQGATLGVDASGAEVSGDDTGAMDAGSHTPDEHTGNGVGGDHAAAAAAELEAA
ncbi:hypothetical protein HaLaN_28752, partial [Haematococcus lacustris]